MSDPIPVEATSRYLIALANLGNEWGMETPDPKKLAQAAATLSRLERQHPDMPVGTSGATVSSLVEEREALLADMPQTD